MNYLVTSGMEITYQIDIQIYTSIYICINRQKLVNVEDIQMRTKNNQIIVYCPQITYYLPKQSVQLLNDGQMSEWLFVNASDSELLVNHGEILVNDGEMSI